MTTTQPSTPKTVADTAQNLQDLYFERGATVSKETWDATVNILTTHSLSILKALEERIGNLRGVYSANDAKEAILTIAKELLTNE